MLSTATLRGLVAVAGALALSGCSAIPGSDRLLSLPIPTALPEIRPPAVSLGCERAEPPLPPDARDCVVVGASVRFSARQAPQDVVAFYVDRYVKAGFRRVDDGVLPGVANFEKGGERVSIIASAEAGGASVIVANVKTPS